MSLFTRWIPTMLRMPTARPTTLWSNEMKPRLLPMPQTTNMRFKHAFKTNKSAAKRFRQRSSGSLKRNKAGKSHNTGYKTRQRTNRLGSTTGIKGTKIEKRIRKMLGVM